MKIFQNKSVFFASAAAIFLILLLFVFREFVFNPDLLMLNSDQLNGIGSRILRAESAVLTEWDDSRLGGVPTIDALFADAYHPLVWVQFLMDPARAVGFKFILTLWVAFMSAFALGWHLIGNKWWAILLGGLYAFSPEFFTYIYGGHDGKMMVFAIAPLALLAIRKVVREKSIPYMIILALSIAWMILGSHLQLTYLFLWGAGLYTLYEVFFRASTKKIKGLALAAAALAFGLMLSSFQLVPPYLYTTQESVRGGESHTNYGHAVSWSLHQEEMAQMLLPGFIGVDVYEQNPETGNLEGSSFIDFSMDELRQMNTNGSPFYWGHNAFKLDHNYAGALLTFLGFLCLFLPGKRRYGLFWGFGAVIALSYGMGDHSPLFKLWYNILPGVKNFRAPGMALFWLPLLLVMMAAPVIKALSSTGEEAQKSKIPLLHGTLLYALLLLLVVIARFNWSLFIGPVGLITCLIYGALCLGVMSVDDQGKKLSFENLMNAYKAGLPKTSRILQIAFMLGFAFIGIFLMSGQNLLNDPITAPYFKPLNATVMEATASKIIPSFILVIITLIATWKIFSLKIANAQKVILLALLSAIELFFINGVFIQNVQAKEYLNEESTIVKALKAPYANDSINTPRVLSLSRNKTLSGNVFPKYHLRNADGFHDNELASYRAFRGGQGNENYLLNINDQNAAHPFLDLMNIGAIIFDTQRGTTYMVNSTAMGEAYLYGNFTVMDDEKAIATLKTAAIRQPVEQKIPADSTTEDSLAVKEALPEEDKNFYYKETVILSEAPENAKSLGIPEGYAKLIESPKMDTQIFEVKSDRDCFMVVAGNYHPYWNATIDGNATQVYKAFGNLRAVYVPQGTHKVKMEYRSKPFHTCLKFSLIAIIHLVVFGIVWGIFKRKKK